MREHLLFAYNFHLGQATRLVSDLTDEQMVQQPHGVINHPAWTLGHLAWVANHLAGMFGADVPLPDGWTETFKPGGTPSNNAADYPSKEEILAQLTAQHEAAAKAVADADPSVFANATPDEQTRAFMPTVGDFAAILMTTHEAGHLGQVTAWRRAMGLPPAN